MITTHKLVTGEEVVGNSFEETNTVTISKPRTFQIIQDSAGNVRAGLVPWFLSDPEVEVTISKTHILASAETTVQLQEAYLKQTSSLELPSSKIFVN
jgi:hypothetical protein